MNDGVYVAVNSNVRGDLTDEWAANFVAMFTNLSFGSFDDFTKTSNNVCVIRPDLTRQEGYNCTCCDRTGYTGPTGRTGPSPDPSDPTAYCTHTSLAQLLASSSLLVEVYPSF